MRICIINSFDLPGNVLADSSFLLPRRIIEGFPKDFFALLCLPRDELKGFRHYDYRGKLGLPDNCTPLFYPMYASRSQSELLISEKLFESVHPIVGKQSDYDVILTNNASSAQKLKEWTSPNKGQSGGPPPVVIHDYNTPYNDPRCELMYIKGNPAKMLSHYAGYAMADYTIFTTEYQRKMAIKEMRALMSPAVVREFMKKNDVIWSMFGARTLQAIANNRRKRSRPTIYWGGRLTMTKGGNLAAEVCDYLFSYGNDVGIVFTIPGKSQIDKLLVGKHKHMPMQIELHSDLTQEEAMKVMSSCHVSIFAQSLRHGPAAPMEQIAAGLIVLINKDDAMGMLPSDYPWFWGNKTELYTLLKQVLENYDSEVRKVKKWQEFVIKHRSIEATSDQFSQVFRDVYKPVEEFFQSNRSSILYGRIEEWGELPKCTGTDVVTWNEYVEGLLTEHTVYKQLKGALRPAMHNPWLWGVYQILKAHMDVDESLPDPIISRRE